MARAELSPGIESLRGKLAGWSVLSVEAGIINIAQELRRRPLRQRFGGMSAVRQV